MTTAETLPQTVEKDYREEVLIPEPLLQQRLDQIARKIQNEYQDQQMLAVCVLNGAYITTAEITKRLNLPDASLDFVGIQSYDGTKSTKKPEIVLPMRIDPRGRNILIFEDIIDKGWTLNFFVGKLRDWGAATTQVCSLLDKPSRREVAIGAPAIVGFQVPPVWVEGFGLDTDQLHRFSACISYRNYKFEPGEPPEALQIQTPLLHFTDY